MDLSKNHWSPIIKESCITLNTIIWEIDPESYEKAKDLPINDKSRFIAKPNQGLRREFDSKWERLDEQLKGK